MCNCSRCFEGFIIYIFPCFFLKESTRLSLVGWGVGDLNRRLLRSSGQKGGSEASQATLGIQTAAPAPVSRSALCDLWLSDFEFWCSSMPCCTIHEWRKQASNSDSALRHKNVYSSSENACHYNRRVTFKFTKRPKPKDLNG